MELTVENAEFAKAELIGFQRIVEGATQAVAALNDQLERLSKNLTDIKSAAGRSTPKGVEMMGNLIDARQYAVKRGRKPKCAN